MKHRAGTSGKTHCCFCSMQCQLELEPAIGSAGCKTKASEDFPVATGRVCQKGIHSMEHVMSSDRVTVPLTREKRTGSWKAAGWSGAIAQISERIKRIQQQYGKDAVAVYGGGSLTNEAAYLLGKFARIGLGTRYIDYNGRYCMSAAATAMNMAFGIDRGLTFPLSDIPDTQYLILAGTNAAECQPTMMPYMVQAKKNGAIVVTIDPRNTMTSKLADIHVRIQPGFDSVFVNGLLHVMVEEGLADEHFIRQHTLGYEALKQAVKPFTPDYVESVTGILAAVTRSIARGFAQAETGIVMTARGLEQQVNGVEHALNYMNLNLITGKIGRPGCGFGSITGQANGQGGREHGQKADQLPGYRSIEDPEARTHVAKVWGISAEKLPGKGVSAYELFAKIDSGEIRAMLVFASNPVVSSPNSTAVQAALEKLELLVVVDMFESETASLADWLLPAQAFAETEGTLTNLEGRVFHRAKAMETIGECKDDVTIMCELAGALGKEAYFSYSSSEEVFLELCAASKGGRADYSGLDYTRLKKAKGVYWPCPASDHPGTPRLFGQGFAHKDQKARIHAIRPKLPAETTDKAFPYLLTTGRLANHYLSGTQTRRSPNLLKRAPKPIAEIHPWLAKQLQFRSGAMLRLSSRRGSAVFEVRITEGIHPKTIFVPFHWGGELSVNRLTNDALEELSRMPEFKLCAVAAECVYEDGKF